MRLIDGDALKERFEMLSYDDWNQGAGTTWARAFEESADVVECAPTIDAVEVVRCEDCAHYGNDCVLLFPADGYCYDGERREG